MSLPRKSEEEKDKVRAEARERYICKQKRMGLRQTSVWTLWPKGTRGLNLVMFSGEWPEEIADGKVSLILRIDDKGEISAEKINLANISAVSAAMDKPVSEWDWAELEKMLNSVQKSR